MWKPLRLVPAILFIGCILHTPATAQDELENALRDMFELEEPFVLDEAWKSWVYSMRARFNSESQTIAESLCKTDDPLDPCFAQWLSREIRTRIMLEVAGARQRIETLQRDVRRMRKAHQDLRRNYDQLVDVLVESDLIRYE